MKAKLSQNSNLKLDATHARALVEHPRETAHKIPMGAPTRKLKETGYYQPQIQFNEQL